MVEVVGLDVLNLLLILALAWVLGNLAERVGYPAMMGEILAGILFGPALLGFIGMTPGLEVLAELGVFLLMVYVGMEVDIDELVAMGPDALVIAIGGFLVPFGLGYGAGVLVGAGVAESLFIGIAMAATSLATKSRILVDLDIMDTRISKVLIGGALVADVAVLIVFAAVMGFVEVGTFDPVAVAFLFAKVLAFFGAVILIGYKFLPVLWRRLEDAMDEYGFMTKTSLFTVAILVSLVFAAMAHLVQLHIIIGGFMAGMFLRQADVRHDAYERLHNVFYDVAIGLFTPIFFVVVAFELTLDVFREDLALMAFLIAVAFVGKIVGSWLFAFPTKLTSSEGFVVGLGMNGRGTVEIIIASIGLSAGVISQSLFSILVFLALLTTALVPVTMKWGVDWLEGKGELFRQADADTEADG